MIRTALVGIFLGLYILLLGPPFILHCLITRDANLLFRIGVAGARFALRLIGVRIRAEGTENIPPCVCLFVGNHTSNLDPPAVVSAIPRRVSMLGKKEVWKVPIFGRALDLARFVPVDRSNRDAARISGEKAAQYLREGVSFLIFPEGTRSPDGRLRPFKRGTFAIAIRAGVSVVPVSVAGAQRLMAKGSFAIRPGEVVVHFHPAINAKEYSIEHRDALARRSHDVVASGLPEDQRPLKS
ncbi:MAG: 1-acyl-sn-glycerol-3-phosphate acyltransferase [Acidobacteria bacterium]|nr:1-acyl-sn-glycerol-3-phosphate acyltransferase [Acidobacteriota bacterium]